MIEQVYLGHILVLSANGSSLALLRRAVLFSGRAELARAKDRKQNSRHGRQAVGCVHLQAPRRGIEIAPAPAGGISRFIRIDNLKILRRPCQSDSYKSEKSIFGRVRRRDCCCSDKTLLEK